MPLAIRLHQHGGPEVLVEERVSLPSPAAGEALVAHEAIGVNFIDTYHRSGLYPLPLPATLGVEAAGTVTAVGKGVTVVKPGDRVGYVVAKPCAYAQEALVPAERLIPLPDGISSEVAAASLLKGMTVEFLIRRAFAVQPGQTVLWHAAAGGVGLLACQWLAHLGARVIGTVSTEQKAQIARAHGCKETILYNQEDFAARVRELTAGRGVPVVYDSVGRATLQGSLDSLQPRGLLVGFGNASGKAEPLDLLQLSQKGSLFVTRPTLFHYIATREELLAASAALFAVLQSGAVKVDVSLRRPLSGAAEVHRLLETRATHGQALLLP